MKSSKLQFRATSSSAKLTAVCLFLFASALPATLVQAQNSPGLPGSFLNHGAGPRGFALGGAFTAVANDASASLWNPAGLAQQNRFQMAASSLELSLGRNQRFAGLSLPITRGTMLGVNWTNASIGGIEARTGNSSSADFLFSHADHAFWLTLAQKLGGFFYLGANAKMLYQKQHLAQSFGQGFDVSFLVKPSTFLSLGFTAQNLLTSANWSTGLQENYPHSLRAGVALNFWRKLLISADVTNFSSESPSIFTGVEMRVSKHLPIRLGYQSLGISGGAGLVFPMQNLDISIDYGFGQNQVDGTDIHSFSFSFALKPKRKAVFSEIAYAPQGARVEETEKRSSLKKGKKEARQKWVQVTARRLNVRKGPGVEFTKIAETRRGDKLKVLKRKNGWLHVVFSGEKRGWVHEDYVRILK